MPWWWKQLEDERCDQKGVTEHEGKTGKHVKNEKAEISTRLNEPLQPIVDVPGREQGKHDEEDDENAFEFHGVNLRRNGE